MPIVQANSVVMGNSVNVADLFSVRNSVPVYQRDYVWQDKQVEALWDDLTQHYSRYANKEEELIKPEGYFLGAMVVIAGESGGADEVIDGQQRLTSLSIIAAVFLDAIVSGLKSSNNKDGINFQLTKILADFESQSFVPKLSFSDSDINKFFFESCFLRKGRTQKEAYWNESWCKERISRKKSPYFKIKGAILTGQKKLDAFLRGVKDAEKRQKRLTSFIELVLEGVILLRIKAMSYPNAYAIFESLNNRGIPLSQSDLIKNELLKSSSQSELEEVAENWQTARQTVDSIEIISMPDFVHYSYISRNGLVKARDLYSKVKQSLSSPEMAKSYSEGLLADAEALENLTDNFSAEWLQETHSMLKDVKNVLNIRHCYPFLITSYHKHSSNKTVFAAHVEAVMNFAFRYMKIMEEPLESFSSIIGEACKLVNQGNDITSIRALFRHHAPDANFVQKFAEASISNTKLAYFVVYYLEKEQLGGTFPADHGLDQNLEHIMPKTPTQSHWASAYELKTQDKSKFKEYLWRVGNLLPLTAEINKSLKNKSIALKIKDPGGYDYTSGKHSLKSPYDVSMFIDNDEWTVSSIDTRQKYLAEKFAVNAWRL